WRFWRHIRFRRRRQLPTRLKGHTMDFTDMTDEQLYELIEAAQTELGKRQSQATFDAQIAEVVKAARGNVIPDRGKGEPWEPVKGYQDVYFKGEIVTHNGKTWQSNIDNNAGTPGESGWRELVEDNDDGTPNYPVWKQTRGYEYTYEPGAIVWHPNKGDQLYKNVHTA